MKVLLPALLLGPALVLAGCGRTPAGSAAAEPTQLHKNVPPHGGTPVALGDDYCLEFVRDAGAGTLSAYVLDDEMEDFIRIPAPAITIVARVGGEDRTLVLSAVANSATGETVGDTSLFQARADWLKTAGSLAATLQGVTVRGAPFSNLRFTLPPAPDKD